MKIKEAKIIEVIEITNLEGNGTDSSPLKEVFYYYRKNGEEIGKIDYHPEPAEWMQPKQKAK